MLFVLFLAVPGSVPTSDAFFPHCRLRVHLYCLGGGSVTLHRVHCPCEKGPQPLQHVLQFCPLVAFPSRTLQGVTHGICSCTLTNAFPRVEATTAFLYPPYGQPHAVLYLLQDTFGGFISISGGWMLLFKKLNLSC